MTKFPFDTEKLIEIYRENDVTKIGIFGSMARGEAGEASDIDVLVEFSKRKSLLTFVALQRILSTAIGRQIDLQTEVALSPYLREQILNEMLVIYDAG